MHTCIEEMFDGVSHHNARVTRAGEAQAIESHLVEPEAQGEAQERATRALAVPRGAGARSLREWLRSEQQLDEQLARLDAERARNVRASLETVEHALQALYEERGAEGANAAGARRIIGAFAEIMSHAGGAPGQGPSEYAWTRMRAATAPTDAAAAPNDDIAERIVNGTAALARAVWPAEERNLGGTALWARIRNQTLAAGICAWEHAINLAGGERTRTLAPSAEATTERSAERVREVLGAAATGRSAIAPRAGDASPVFAMLDQLPYDPERAEWSRSKHNRLGCNHAIEGWVQRHAAVVAVLPGADQGLASSPSGRLLRAMATHTGDERMRELHWQWMARQIVVAGIDDDGYVVLRSPGTQATAHALRTLAEERDWAPGSAPFGTDEMTPEAPEDCLLAPEPGAPLFVVADPALMHRAPSEGDDPEQVPFFVESTRARAGHGKGCHPATVVLSAAARLGGARDVALLGKDLEQGDTFQYVPRRRGGELVLDRSGSAIMDPPAVGVWLSQALVALEAQNRGSATRCVLWRTWSIEPTTDLIVAPRRDLGAVRTTPGLDGWLGGVHEARQSRTRERSRDDLGPKGRRYIERLRERPDPGRLREEALRVLLLVPSEPEREHHDPARAAVRTLCALIRRQSEKLHERHQPHKIDLIVPQGEEALREAVDTVVWSTAEHGGLGMTIETARVRAGAPSLRIVRTPINGPVDIALVGAIDATRSDHAMLRAAFAHAIEHEIPSVQWGSPWESPEQGHGILFGDPQSRAHELALGGAALYQPTVRTSSASLVLSEAQNTQGECALVVREGVWDETPAPEPGNRAEETECAALLASAVLRAGTRPPPWSVIRPGTRFEGAEHWRAHRDDLRLPPSPVDPHAHHRAAGAAQALQAR